MSQRFFPGKYISEERLLEMKKKNSLAHKGKITRNIKIKDIDNNIVFFSLKEAAKYHNISPSLMSTIVKGKRKKYLILYYYNFYWLWLFIII